MGVKVLIVDDQETFRRVARETVEAIEGFDVVGEATGGEESVTLAAALKPDLVLMDLNLPGIDGAEATRRIVAGSPRVRVVLVSTYDEADLAAPAAACGALAYLQKSRFAPDRLLEIWSSAGVEG